MTLESDSKGCQSPDTLSTPSTQETSQNHPQQGTSPIYRRFSEDSFHRCPCQYEIIQKTPESSYKDVKVHKDRNSGQLAQRITRACDLGLSQGCDSHISQLALCLTPADLTPNGQHVVFREQGGAGAVLQSPHEPESKVISKIISVPLTRMFFPMFLVPHLARFPLFWKNIAYVSSLLEGFP